MRLWEQRLSGFLKSKASVFLLVVASVAMTYNAMPAGGFPEAAAGHSIAFTRASAWISSPAVSMWVNQLLLFLIAAMMLYINRRFNILRTQTVLYSGLFMFMTAATPRLAGQLSASTLLALAMLCAVLLYYICYNRHRETRPVFLASTLVGAVALVDYSAYLYVPVLIAGLAQMRILSVRSILASFIGILTPLWITWGLSLADVHASLRFYFVSPSVLITDPTFRPVVAAAAVTLVAGFVVGSAVLIKVLSLNARARSLNGLIALIAIATGLFMVVNYENLLFYMTILNATVAFQVVHFFRINHKRPGYLAVVTLIILYTAIYIWAVATQ